MQLAVVANGQPSLNSPDGTRNTIRMNQVHNHKQKREREKKTRLSAAHGRSKTKSSLSSCHQCLMQLPNLRLNSSYYCKSFAAATDSSLSTTAMYWTESQFRIIIISATTRRPWRRRPTPNRTENHSGQVPTNLQSLSRRQQLQLASLMMAASTVTMIPNTSRCLHRSTPPRHRISSCSCSKSSRARHSRRKSRQPTVGKHRYAFYFAVAAAAAILAL